MWRQRVLHATGYAYPSPATASYNEARLTPRSDSRQNVVLNRVETVPCDKVVPVRRLLGHRRDGVRLARTAYRVDRDVGVSGRDRPPDPVTEELSWSDLQQAAVIDRYDELLRPTDYTPSSKRIAAVGKRIAKEHEPADAVIAAAAWVRSELDYVKGSTGVHTSGSDALREGKGVCQDFVHLSLMVVRGMGIPARYVSGYHHPDADAVIGETVDGHSHAWIQAWTGSWWDHDPTSDSEINEQYVTVGVGRTIPTCLR